MPDSEIVETLRQFILERYLQGEDPTLLTPTTSLVSGGVLDSLSILETVSFLESAYGITLAAHELDRVHFETLESIADLVQSKRDAVE